MRLVEKWRTTWTMLSEGIEQWPTELVRVENRWVDVIRLGHGQPVILVPGLAGSWKLLLPLARALARHFEVITYSLRGDEIPWGGLEADWGRAVEIGEYAEDLSALIDHLGLELPTVFGVSFGGAIALELAAEHSEQLGALVVSGAEAQFRPTIASTIARQVLERFPLPSDSRFVNQFFHLLYGARPDPGPLVEFVTHRIWETEQRVIAARLMALETFDVSDRVWKIDVPSVVLAGSRDVVVRTARQHALADGIPGARCETIEGAGHVGFLTHRADFVRHIRRHLRRVRQRIAP
jgi:pimeloyl-ACP methyl ester carboxylesterase